MGQKVSYCTLSISSLNIDQFSQFFISRLCKKFGTQWHTHYTYYFATLPLKISKNTQYLQMDTKSSGKFLKYLT